MSWEEVTTGLLSRCENKRRSGALRESVPRVAVEGPAGRSWKKEDQCRALGRRREGGGNLGRCGAKLEQVALLKPVVATSHQSGDGACRGPLPSRKCSGRRSGLYWV